MALDMEVLQAMSVLYLHGTTPYQYSEFVRMQQINKPKEIQP